MRARFRVRIGVRATAQLAAPPGHLHLLSEVRLEGLKLGLGLGLGLRYSVTCSARFAWKASS